MGHKGAFTLAGKPILERTLTNLRKHGYRQIVIVISPQDAEQRFTEKLVAAMDLGLKVQYVTQPEAKGMGDATLQGLSLLSPARDQRFAVISAYQFAAGELLDQMTERGEEIVLASAATTSPQDYGMLAFNQAGLATAIIEKPAAAAAPSEYKVLSIYVLTQAYAQILAGTPAGEYNFEAALATALDRTPAAVMKLKHEPLTLKYPWHLLKFLDHFLHQQKSFRAATAQVAATAVIDESKGPVVIDEYAQIGHASKIVGPCYIGKHVKVGDFVLIRQSSLETETQVGCFSEVARSVLAEDVHMHSGYIGDSIIGQGARLGAGFITANKRLDRASIGVQIKGKVVDSYRNRLGALIGAKAQIGVHVCVMPGKCIAAGSTVLPQQSVTHNLNAQGESGRV